MNTIISSKSAKVAAGVMGLIAGLAMFASTATAYTFSTNLKVGSTGVDVKNLQMVLNMNADTAVDGGGAGSAGKETSYFGPATKSAVIRFQEKYASDILAPVGLTSGTGFVGASTRAHLNTTTGGTTTTTGMVTGCTSLVGFSPTTGQSCATGAVTTTIPAGCTSTVGFSSTTGASCGSGTVVVATSGPISASLANDNPSASAVVLGQAKADLTHVVFTGNGTVTSITLNRSGISDQNSLTNVYLYDGVTRLTDGYSFSNSGSVTLNNLNIAVNGSKTIAIKADVGTTAFGNIAIGVTGYTAGGIASTANVQGNYFSLVSGTLATAAFTASSTVSSTVDAGTKSFTVWSTNLQVNTRTLNLKSIALNLVGSAPSDALANVRLFVDGVDTGSVATLSTIQGSNYLTVDFSASPKALTTGSHTLEVRADVEKGSFRTVQVKLANAADIALLDTQFGMYVTATAVTTYGTATSVTINKGSTATSVDTTFSSLSSVAPGATNAVIGKFNVKAYGEDVKISSMVVDIATTTVMTPATGGLANVALYYNGGQVGASQSITGEMITGTPTTAETGHLTFTFNQTIPAGTTGVFEVRADMQSAAGVNYTAGGVKVTLPIGSSNAQGLSSSESLNVPTGSAGTNGLTISASSLSVAKAPGYANQTTTVNKDVKLGSYVIQNTGTTENITISNLAVAVNVTTMALTNLSNLTTSVTTGGSTLAATNNFPVSITLTPGQSKTVDVSAYFGAATSGAASTTLTVTARTASNASASQSAVVGQTITIGVPTFDAVTLNSADTSASQFVSAAAVNGATDATNVVYTFKASNGPVTIEKVKILVNSTSGTPVSGISITDSGTTYAGTPDTNNLWTIPLGTTGIEIPSGLSGKNVTAKLSYGKVGVGGTTSGAIASTTLNYVLYKANGVASTATTTMSVLSNNMYLVGSAPTLAVAPTTNTALQSLSDTKIFETTIAPNASNAITVNTLVFTVSTSTVGNITSPKLVNTTQNADSSTAIVSASCTGVATVTCTLPSGYSITGASKFALYATTGTDTGTTGQTSSVTTSLAASSLFSWADTAGNSSTAITTDNTTYLLNYPTGKVWTVSKAH